MACSDGRPGEEEAKLHFHRLYPDVRLISVKVSEDEVVARSFFFRYQKGPPGTKEKQIEIQFMEDPETGEWVAKPEPPARLP